MADYRQRFGLGRVNAERDPIKRRALVESPPNRVTIWEYSFWPPCEHWPPPTDPEWGLLHVVMRLDADDFGTQHRVTVRTRDWRMIAQLVGRALDEVDLGGMYEARPGWPDEEDDDLGDFTMDDRNWVGPMEMFTGPMTVIKP